MPPVNIHLIALAPSKTIPQYLSAVKSASQTPPLVASRAIRWIIRPQKIDVSELLDTKWDLLLVMPKSSPLKEELLAKEWVSAHFTLTAGVPSSLVNGFGERNERLLHPRSGDVPALSASKSRMANSAQGLELSKDLLQWSESFTLGQGAVSMLNLLAFRPGKEAHASYQKYGQGFAQSSGAKRGGTAKIVGKVIDDQGAKWDEIALAHYPSINHFTEMLGSEDYQEINHKYRLPALEDTCILCTSELDPVLSDDKAKL